MEQLRTGLDEPLAELEAILRDELAAYTHLVNRLPFKLALIKKNRTEQLGRLLTQEASEMRALDALELRRCEVSGAIASHFQAPVQTLNELLPLLSPAWRKRLAPLGDDLRLKVADLQAGNHTCRELLRLSIDYATYTLDVIAQAATPDGLVYDGSVAQAPSLLLDWRA